MFIQVLAPAVVMLEQQLCGSRNVHGAEYRGWQGMGKGPRRQRAHVADVLIYAGISAGRSACPDVDVRLGLKDG
ncbi:Uncharacterised protein [Yersinia kristensenii]|nr:Uncharacterised protein [Yersinia kristensenii]